MTRNLVRTALALLLTAPFAANAQNRAIDFNPKMPFSDGFVAGNTLYVAGQQGPDDSGKVTGTTIDFQTERAINAIRRIVEKAGFKMNDLVSVTVYVVDLNDVPKMNEVYKRLMPNPKPAEPLSKSPASSVTQRSKSQPLPSSSS
jgi:2-iminobutanoate/2-iminopropanoate deaminase